MYLYTAATMASRDEFKIFSKDQIQLLLLTNVLTG